MTFPANLAIDESSAQLGPTRESAKVPLHRARGLARECFSA